MDMSQSIYFRENFNMKFFHFTFLTLLPVFLVAQTFTDYASPLNLTKNSKIIKVSESEDAIKVYFITEVNTDDNVDVNLLYAVRYENGDLDNPKVFGKHILSNSHYTSDGSYKVSKGKMTYGTQDDVITYEGALELYDDLKDLTTIDYANRKLPDTYYKSSLNRGWRQEVVAFESTKYVRAKDGEAKPEARKDKGLLGKLVDLSNDLAGVQQYYVDVDKVSHDWKESYNGGQDKKNHWTIAHSAACQTTGNALAVNYKKLKDDKYHHNSNGEIVLFDNQGELVTRHEIKTDLPYAVKMTDDHHSESAQGSTQLDYLTLVSQQVVEKKYNSDGNDKQYAIMSVDKDANTMYSYTYDLPYEKRINLDTLITMDGGKSVVYGFCLREKGHFLLEAAPSGQKMTTFTPVDLGARDFAKYVEHKGDTYILYTNKDLSTKIVNQIAVYKVKDGDTSMPQYFEFSMKNRTAANVEVLVNGDDLVLVTKERAEGLKDFKFEMGRPTFYKLSGDSFEKIGSFEDDSRALIADHVTEDMTSYSVGSNHYFLSKKFVEGPKGKQVVKDYITKLQL